MRREDPVESEQIIYKIIPSPIGEFIAGVTSKGCCLLEFYDRGGLERIRARINKRYRSEMIEGESPLIGTISKQMNEYFSGKRKEFDFPLDLKGTPFERSVWNQLLQIPYGETRSYGDLAVALGKPGAARAVGKANGANYVPVVVPCHRVIEADGSLRGYGGGLWRKRWLLELEGAIPKELFPQHT